MTTTDNPVEATGEVISDLGAARERRAMTLLVRRGELAAQWAEALSHRMPDAEDLAYEVAVVEQAISRNHPAVFDQHFAGWITADAARLHAPGALPSHCSLCVGMTEGTDVA